MRPLFLVWPLPAARNSSARRPTRTAPLARAANGLDDGADRPETNDKGAAMRPLFLVWTLPQEGKFMGGKAAERLLSPQARTSKSAAGKGPKLAALIWPCLGSRFAHFLNPRFLGPPETGCSVCTYYAPRGKGRLWHEYAKTTQVTSLVVV